MKKYNYLIIALLIGCFTAQAQYGKQKKADKLYQDLAYYEAVDVYKELLEKDYRVKENNMRLGDAYMNLRSPENAVHYYGEIVENDDISPEYYYKYAQALRGVKRYKESEKWLKKYLEDAADAYHIEEILENGDHNITSRYKISKAEFNSDASDFGVFEKDKQIYFVSARPEENEKEKVYSWNGEPYLDIYQLDTEKKVATKLPGEVNTKLHDGPAVISPDGKTMYFNRNNYINNREGKKDKNSTNNLKIYKAVISGNSWTDIQELPFNSNDYSVGHPALSPDGKLLYFTSDMPGGHGGTDLYRIEILDDNSYGEPENLGDLINTSENEGFPFIDEKGILYFSSNGHGGFGLTDIFRIELENANAEVENPGDPINSNLDDFAYYRSEGSRQGYISSNRGGGSDNIYIFNKLNPLVLKGQVLDAVNNNPVAQATIRVLNEEGDQMVFIETDEDGNYEAEIERDKHLPLEVKQIEYEIQNDTLNTTNKDDVDEVVYNIHLKPVEDVEYLAEIENIYFDFDQHEIRESAALELDKLVDLMKNEYPGLVIEISSHTDFRGSDKYNEELAIRRAQATNNYLISKGIDETRIEAYKGYGERQPAIECERCNEDEHQLNRRSMFTVVRME